MIFAKRVDGGYVLIEQGVEGTLEAANRGVRAALADQLRS